MTVESFVYFDECFYLICFLLSSMGLGVFMSGFFSGWMFKEIRRPRRWTNHLYLYTFFHLIRLWCYGYGYGELEDLISCALYYMLLAWLVFFSFSFSFNIRFHFIGCMGFFSRLFRPSTAVWIDVFDWRFEWQGCGHGYGMACLYWSTHRSNDCIMPEGIQKKQVPLVRDLMFS